MEISNPQAKQQPLLNQPANQIQKGNETSPSAGLQAAGSSVANANGVVDSVSLSADSLQLAKATTQQATANVESISSQQHAQAVVEKIVSAIRQHPSAAAAVYGHVNTSSFKTMLG